MVTREEFEALRRIVKELIDTNKKQMQFIQNQQKQLDLINEALIQIRKLV